MSYVIDCSVKGAIVERNVVFGFSYHPPYAYILIIAIVI